MFCTRCSDTRIACYCPSKLSCNAYSTGDYMRDCQKSFGRFGGGITCCSHLPAPCECGHVATTSHLQYCSIKSVSICREARVSVCVPVSRCYCIKHSVTSRHCFRRTGKSERSGTARRCEVRGELECKICKQVAVWRLGSWGLNCWKDSGYYGTIMVTREPVTNEVSGQKWIVTVALPEGPHKVGPEEI
jgi:hypothetical protein